MQGLQIWCTALYHNAVILKSQTGIKLAFENRIEKHKYSYFCSSFGYNHTKHQKTILIKINMNKIDMQRKFKVLGTFYCETHMEKIHNLLYNHIIIIIKISAN